MRTVEPARPWWWSQVITAVAFAWGYDALRALRGNVRVLAIRHGRTVARLDARLHAGWLASLTQWVDHHALVADVLSGYYVVMHLAMVSITLIVLWVDGRRYRWHRDALLLLSAVGFVVFWAYPVAPPRLIGAGYGDSVRAVLPFAYSAESHAANLYAAVPSLHVAWALWCTIALWGVSRRLCVRGLVVSHSVITVVTVLGTGNHYLVDVLSGAGVTVVGYLLLPGVIALGRLVAPHLVRVTTPSVPRRSSGGGSGHGREREPAGSGSGSGAGSGHR